MDSIIRNQIEGEFHPEMSSVEREKIVSSSIDLSFFRHGEKEINKNKSDEEIDLNEKGREHSINASREVNTLQSVAFGSPRRRAQHTAGLVMGGKLDDITGNETLEELKVKLAKNLNFGNKIGVDKNLDFEQERSSEFGQKIQEAFDNGHFLTFLVEESDKLADDLQNNEARTYSRVAGQIAQIIKKYLTIAPRWDALVCDNNKAYEKKLRRFFGSHQGTIEPFLTKIIEKTQGIEARNTFIKMFGDKLFDFVESFDVKIETIDSAQQNIRIIYKRQNGDKVLFEYDEIVPKEIIDEIILEGQS